MSAETAEQIITAEQILADLRRLSDAQKEAAQLEAKVNAERWAETIRQAQRDERARRRVR